MDAAAATSPRVAKPSNALVTMTLCAGQNASDRLRRKPKFLLPFPLSPRERAREEEVQRRRVRRVPKMEAEGEEEDREKKSKVKLHLEVLL